MTQDEIIRMAREAGFAYELFDTVQEGNGLERFAALVSEVEREKICHLLRQVHDALSIQSIETRITRVKTLEEAAKMCEEFVPDSNPAFDPIEEQIAAAIRGMK